MTNTRGTVEWRFMARRDWLIPAGLLICPALSFAAAYAGVALRYKVIGACRADTAPGEGWYVLFFLGPVITIVAFVVIATIYGATAYAWGRRHPWVPLLAGILVAIVAVYVGVLVMDIPGHTPDCPSGRPPWWPRWLPL